LGNSYLNLSRVTKSNDDGACLQVVRSGRVIFRRTSDSRDGYTLGQPANKECKVPAIVDGTDITGRGHPDMIVAYWTGGAHCCLLHYVFELESTFRLLATLDAEDDDMAHFAQLDGDNRDYYLAADWTFAYWPGSFAGSPSHSVVLRYEDDHRGGGFHLALDKMKRDPPTSVQWYEAMGAVNGALQEDAMQGEVLAATLWNTVLDLIYIGHSDLAWRFINEAGPKAQQGTNVTLADFCSVLKASPYWPDLEPTVKDMPSACAHAKPDEARRRPLR
jgi:hypothetical protein